MGETERRTTAMPIPEGVDVIQTPDRTSVTLEMAPLGLVAGSFGAAILGPGLMAVGALMLWKMAASMVWGQVWAVVVATAGLFLTALALDMGRSSAWVQVAESTEQGQAAELSAWRNGWLGLRRWAVPVDQVAQVRVGESWFTYSRKPVRRLEVVDRSGKVHIALTGRSDQQVAFAVNRIAIALEGRSRCKA